MAAKEDLINTLAPELVSVVLDDGATQRAQELTKTDKRRSKVVKILSRDASSSPPPKPQHHDFPPAVNKESKIKVKPKRRAKKKRAASDSSDGDDEAGLESGDESEDDEEKALKTKVRVLRESLKDSSKRRKVASALPRHEQDTSGSLDVTLNTAPSVSSDKEDDDGDRGRRYKTKRELKRLQKLGTTDCEVTIDRSNRYMADYENTVSIARPHALKRSGGHTIDGSSDSEESDTDADAALCCEDRRPCACVCCRRRTPKELCCYSLPYMPVLIFPFLLTNITLFVIWAVFWYVFPSLDIDGVPVYRWALFLIIWVNAYLAFQVVFHFVLILLTACCLSTRFLIYTHDMERPAALVIWAIILFATWKQVLVGAQHTTLAGGDRVAQITLVIACLVMLKAVMTKWLVGTQNRQYWWDRISESLYKEKVLETLIKDPIPNWRHHHAKEKDEKRPNFSASTKSTVLSYEMFDKLANKLRRLNRMKITVKTKRTEAGGEDLPQWHARHVDRIYGKSDDAREQAATLVAKKLFQKLVSSRNGPRFLALNDFFPYFESQQKAMQAYAVFNETAGYKGFVTEEEMIECVNLIYQDRQTIAHNLKDRDHIGGVVSKILNVFVVMIFLIALLVVLQVDFQSIVIPLSGLILGLSFVFSSAAADAFSAFVFVVFVNAYNVGDMIQFEGDFAYVREINLLTTRLDMIDGKRAIATNVYMASAPIFNYTRSTDYSFFFDVHINIDVPTANIKEFIRRLETYTELRPKTWKTFWYNISDLEHSQSLVLEIFATLATVNWALWLFSTPQTQFMLFVQRQMRDLGIVGHLAPQPVLLRKVRSSAKDGPQAAYSSRKAPRAYSPPVVAKRVGLTDPLGRRGSVVLEDGVDPSSDRSGGERGDKSARSLPSTPRRAHEKKD